jgi:hypothetical protein
MALNNLELATRIRNLITERSTAQVDVAIPHIVAMIPTATETWARAEMKDPEKYDLFKKDFTVALTAGSLDLSSYINGTSGKIDLKDLRNSTIYTTISSVRTPFTWVGSQSQLNAARLLTGPAIFLEGHTLRTRNTDGSQTSLGTASVSFSTVSLPTDAADIPLGLVGDFITYLADLILRTKANGN